MRLGRRSSRPTVAAPLTAGQRRLRAVGRGVAKGAIGVIAAPLLAALVLLALLQHDGVTRWTAQRIANAVNPYPGARITLGGASGTWVTGLELRHVRLVMDGDTALAIDTLRATYDPVGFATGAFAFREILVAGPAVRLRQRPDSTWDLIRPFAGDTAAGAPGPAIAIAVLSVTRGSLTARFHAPGRDSSLRIEAAELRARDLALGNGPLTVRLDSLSLTAEPPSTPGPVTLTAAGSLDERRLDVRRLDLHSPRSRVAGRGTLPRPGVASDSERVDFRLEAAPLAYQDVGPFIPGFDDGGELSVEMQATGTAAKPAVRLEARFTGGGQISLEGEGTSPRAAAPAYRGTLRVRELDPARVTGRPADSGRVNADVLIDLTGPAFDSLTGEARLGITRSSVRGLTADLVTLRAPFDRGRARLALRGTVNDLRVELTGSARPLDSVPTYDLAGTLEDVARFIPSILRDRETPFAARFEAAGRGVVPRRATGRARLTLEPYDTAGLIGFRRAVVTARIADTTLTGRAEIAIGAGDVTLPFTVALGDDVAYRVDGGTIRRLDARSLRSTVSSDLGGTLALEGRGLDPRSLTASVSLELRGAWGGYEVVNAGFAGSARSGLLHGRATARLDSARVDVRAELRPFAATPALIVEEIALDRLDLSRLVPDLPASTLTAIGRVQALGADLGRAAGRIGQPAGAAPTALALTATVELRDSRVAHLDLAHANLALELANDSLRFAAGFDGAGGAARADGIVRIFDRPISYRVHGARFTGLDLAAFAGPALASDLNGEVVLAGHGLSAGELTAEGTLTLDSSAVRDARIPSSRIALRAERGRVTVRGRLTRPRGVASLDADGVLPESGRPGQVEMWVALADTLSVRGDELLPTSLAITATLAGDRVAGAPDRLAGSVSLKGRAGEAVLDSAHATFELARGSVALDTLFVTSPIARIHGAGRIALGDEAAGGASDLDVTARLGDLAPLAPLLGARLLGLDSARLDARFRGSSDSVAFDVTAAGQSFTFDDYRLGTLTATARGWIRGDRSLGALEGSLDAGRARVGLVDVRRVRGETSWNGVQWTTSASLVIDDRRQLTASALLDPRPDVRRLVLESLVLVAGGEPWSLRQPVAARYGDTLAVHGFALTSRDGEITVDGALHDGRDAGLRAELTEIPLAAFSDLIGFPGLAGRLNGAVDVTGTARAPRAVGELTAELQAGEQLAASVRTTFDWYGPQLALDVRVADRQGGSLVVAGTIPQRLGGRPSARASRDTTLDGIDLRLATDPGGLRLDVAEPFLDPRVATDLTGRLIANARVAGTVDAPVLSGELAVREGRIRVPTLGVVYDSIAGRAVLSDNVVRLEAVRVVSGRGAISARGSFALARGTGRRFDLSLDLSGFTAVATSSYEATLSGAIRLHGERGAPVAEGTVAIRDAHVDLSTSQATANVERVELTAADLRTLEQRFGYGLGGVRSPFDGLYEALRLDLTVQLERNTWLRHPTNPQLVLELVGRVRLRKQPDAHLLADGTIELLPGRSYVEQFGARFEVRSGEVVLAGKPEELHFTVETRHEAGTRYTRRQGGTSEPAVVITMKVDGTPDEIRLTLASEPELTDTEIISYLATGRLPNWTPGGGQQEGNLAADIALRQVTRNVQGALGETLPLDVVEVRSDGLKGLTLVAGRYTSPQLYLGVKQPVSFSTDEHTSSTAARTTEFEVEYEAYQWLLMNLQGGSSVLRFFLKTRREY